MNTDDLLTIYKIRMKGTQSYSRGRVQHLYTRDGQRVFGVTWKPNGKDWATEALVKKHLMTCIEKGVDMTGWEIMEFTQQPSKSLNEWFDAKMTFAVIKHS